MAYWQSLEIERLRPSVAAGPNGFCPAFIVPKWRRVFCRGAGFVFGGKWLDLWELGGAVEVWGLDRFFGGMKRRNTGSLHCAARCNRAASVEMTLFCGWVLTGGRATVAEMGKILWRRERPAGPSTAPLAVRLREASLRMTILIQVTDLLKIPRLRVQPVS